MLRRQISFQLQQLNAQALIAEGGIGVKPPQPLRVANLERWISVTLEVFCPPPTDLSLYKDLSAVNLSRI